jgi:hypothetical protein
MSSVEKGRVSISGGEKAEIRFSPMVTPSFPAFVLRASRFEAKDVQNGSSAPNSLPDPQENGSIEELTEARLMLDSLMQDLEATREENRDLIMQNDVLADTIEGLRSTEATPSVEDGLHEEAIDAHEESPEADSAQKVEPVQESPEVSSKEKKLSAAQSRYEQFTLFLLERPYFTIIDPELSVRLQNDFGLSKVEYNNLITKLTSDYKILKLQRENPGNARKLTGITLDVEDLLAVQDKPFVTERVLQKVASLTQENTGSDVPAEAHSHVHDAASTKEKLSGQDEELTRGDVGVVEEVDSTASTTPNDNGSSLQVPEAESDDSIAKEDVFTSVQDSTEDLAKKDHHTETPAEEIVIMPPPAEAAIASVPATEPGANAMIGGVIIVPAEVVVDPTRWTISPRVRKLQEAAAEEAAVRNGQAKNNLKRLRRVEEQSDGLMENYVAEFNLTHEQLKGLHPEVYVCLALTNSSMKKGFDSPVDLREAIMNLTGLTREEMAEANRQLISKGLISYSTVGGYKLVVTEGGHHFLSNKLTQFTAKLAS